jgi:hypothetical protein
MHRRQKRADFTLSAGVADTHLWENVARRLASINGVAEDFVATQFRRYAPGFPLPSVLSSHVSFEAYERLRKTDASESARKVVRYGCEVVKQHLDVGRSLNEIINDPNLPLNPLVCFCIAISASQPELAAPFESAAQEFLSRYPEYLGVAELRSYLPESWTCHN